jgi:hypothetical protein
MLRLNGNSKELFNNRITHTQLLALCDLLANDSTVEFLDLSFNDATPAKHHGDPAAGTFGDNAAKSIARMLRTNKGLRYLMLEGNSITSEGMSHLASVLSGSDGEVSGLQLLNLASNPLGKLVCFLMRPQQIKSDEFDHVNSCIHTLAPFPLYTHANPS